MGVPSSLPLSWIPEDDLLLKDAVEAGASLESLAKGAVQFSRRFSLQELQDRWRSLLYDLDASTEVSSRIIEMEIESSVPCYLKGNRPCSTRGKEYLFRKRKRDSVRSLYYSMRKRVFNEPHTSADVGLPYSRNRSARARKQSRFHSKYPVDNGPPATDCASMKFHYGHLEADYEGSHHALPEIPNGDSASSSDNVVVYDIHMGRLDSLEDDLRDGVVGADFTYGYEENIAQAVGTSGQDNADLPFDQEHVENNTRLVLEDNLVFVNTSSGIQELKQAQILDDIDSYEVEDNPEMLCSDFVGKHNILSQVPECTNSFHQLICTSPSLDVPIWGTIEGILASSMQIPEDFEDHNQGEGVSLILGSKDIETADSPGCDGGNSGIKLNDAFDSSTIVSDNEFMDFSLDDELFLFNVNEDITDRSCLDDLHSILINSPSNNHQNNESNACYPSTSEALNIVPLISDVALSDKPNDPHEDPIFLDNGCEQNVYVSENIVSAAAEERRIIDPFEGFVLCVLNTEDTEIPDNDHLFPFSELHPPSSSCDLEQSFMDNPGRAFCTKTLVADRKATSGKLRIVKEEQVASAEHLECSSKKGSLLSPNLTSTQVEFGPCKSDEIAGVTRNVGIGVDDLKFHTLASSALNSGLIVAMKGESLALDHGIHGTHDLLPKMVGRRSAYANTLLDVADGCQQETYVNFKRAKCVRSRAELASAELSFPDLVAVAASDQEKQLSESESDVPNYSDVEAMILDMDLGPYDHQTSLLHKEISRYQGLDSKKAVVRLEQGARSYMHRAMSSRGAFAVLYGRKLKYYIKNSKVLLGRATKDVDVDIDLQIEGTTNKVSRRQAIIKMKEDGQFSMLNVGKFSIFVNDRELQPMKRVNLTSYCLIEIRGLKFIFEVNKSAVRSHMTSILFSCQDQKMQSN